MTVTPKTYAVEVIGGAAGAIVNEKRSSLRRTQSHYEIANRSMINVEIQSDVRIRRGGLVAHPDVGNDLISFRNILWRL